MRCRFNLSRITTLSFLAFIVSVSSEQSASQQVDAASSLRLLKEFTIPPEKSVTDSDKEGSLEAAALDKATAILEGKDGHPYEESEEGEGEGKEEEEEEEEEQFEEKDIEVASMLLGAVTLVVSLFYLVNWPDDDIRYYSMMIISMTISIFTSVLMFQGINQILEALIKGFAPWLQLSIKFGHMLLYIFAMQLTIGLISGMICDDGPDRANLDEEVWTIADGLRADFGRAMKPAEVEKIRNKTGKRSVWIDPYNVEVPVVRILEELQKRKRRMRCFGMLLAHMSGFAAINAGGEWQHLPMFKTSPWMALIPVPLTVAVLQIVFIVSNKFREGRVEAAKKAGGVGKGLRRAKLCHETVVEAENDVCSLVMSFLLCQVIRFAICGALPDIEGGDQGHVSLTHVSALYLSGMGAGAISIVLSFNAAAEEEEEEGVSLKERFIETFANSFGMLFAWCLLYATRWLFFILATRAGVLVPNTMMGRIILALAVSVFAAWMVFIMDVIDDAFRANSGAGPTAIRTIIQALAILVGFSWEHSFDGGVAAVASCTGSKETAKFVLGTAVFFLLVPAWRRHILTKVMAYEDMKAARLAATHGDKRKGPHSQDRKILESLHA